MAENFFTRANRVLKEVVDKTLEGGFLHTPKDVHDYLIEKGFVEINPEIINEAGEVATRATEAGIAKIPKEEKIMQETKFEIENVAVTKTRRSSGKASIYPFDSLEVGQSFFVPSSDEKPEPWKTMQSTVATATRRYAEDVVDENGNPVMRQILRGPNQGKAVQETKNTRIFVLTEDVKDGKKGARIGRIA